MAEPISTDEAKRQLRVDSTADDTLIAGYIIAAREWVEDYTGLVLTRREVTEALGGFLRQTRLRAWPIDAEQPVTIVYRDISGAEQTIANAELRAASRPGTIYPASGALWPSNSILGGSIDVTFTAGYADPATIPQAVRMAMLVMLTGFYEDREGGEILAAAESSAKRLCRRYKRRTL
jgi:uncharacterized phiE125 gp8 family phage protein